MIPLHEIERRFFAVLGSLSGRMPSKDIEYTRTLIRAGESGVAFEHLCVQLVEHDQAVDRPTYEAIEWLGTTLRLEPEYWERLARAD